MSLLRTIARKVILSEGAGKMDAHAGTAALAIYMARLAPGLYSAGDRIYREFVDRRTNTLLDSVTYFGIRDRAKGQKALAEIERFYNELVRTFGDPQSSTVKYADVFTDFGEAYANVKGKKKRSLAADLVVSRLDKKSKLYSDAVFPSHVLAHIPLEKTRETAKVLRMPKALTSAQGVKESVADIVSLIPKISDPSEADVVRTASQGILDSLSEIGLQLKEIKFPEGSLQKSITEAKDLFDLDDEDLEDAIGIETTGRTVSGQETALPAIDISSETDQPVDIFAGRAPPQEVQSDESVYEQELESAVQSLRDACITLRDEVMQLEESGWEIGISSELLDYIDSHVMEIKEILTPSMRI
jgi:hypothetical protein